LRIGKVGPRVMLTFLKILRSALLLSGAFLTVDGLAAFLLISMHYTFIETFGDLALVEVAVLFILAGLVDFASSVGMAQLRKSFVRGEKGYSASKHKESERQAAILIVAGVVLFLSLVAVGIYIRS
jgi:hypothetical protein